ncbi:hypothetical protein IAR55_001355 [Kwoniella newhampshirensis]|uniref:Major facilitator superfamily (MFS) profile domain-containing protein n=1 Tax=Kwoniella newhampshirensis TaxID=1651941 RepID=A0AAW0Z1X8_9TREE
MTGAEIIDWTSIPNASDHLPWYKNKGLRQLNFMLSIVFMSEFLCGYDGTIVGGLQALPSWREDLGHPNASKIGLLNAVSFIVGLIMGPIVSFVSDKYGRKWPLRFYGYTMVLGTVIGCIAGAVHKGGYGLFVASRAIIGTGLTSFLIGALIIMQEATHPRSRAQVAALFDCNWILGSTLGSFVTFGCSYIHSSWSWRIPYLVQLVPAIYIVVALQFVPETPRWLIAQGRDSEAFAFLVKYHGNGDDTDPLVLFEYEQMRRTLALENEAKKLTWLEVWRQPGNKHRFGLVSLMTFMPQMNGSSVISFYYTVVLELVGIKGTATQTGIGAGINMWSFLVQIFGVLSLGHFRRRSMILIVWPLLMLGMALLAATGAVFAQSGQTNTRAGIASVVFVWLYSGTSSYASPLFYSYPAEVLNYSVRGKGMVVWNTVNQVWGAYGAYVHSIALNKIGWKYYCVFIPILFGQWVLAYFFMVETKGYTLEEIAIAFEGNAAAVAGVDASLQAERYTRYGEKSEESDSKMEEAAVDVQEVNRLA